MEKISQDTDRDFYLNAQEAIEYGLADKIIEKI
jgi:ATP-dependent Clp protease protease subunit